MKLSILEKLVKEDYGLILNGEKWARAEKHDSLVIDRTKQVFHWNSRDLHGDAFAYLMFVRGLTHDASKEYLRQNDGKVTFIHEIRNKEEVIVYPKLVEVFHSNLLNNNKDYFYKRTITDETISRFQLGYHEGFYMIPIYQDGLLKQFQMRRDYPRKEIKNYYRGVGGLLYNSEILKFVDKVVFVEGVTSCVVLNQNNIPAVSSNTGAEGFMVDWFPYFVHQDLIYLIYDNDSAGINGAIRTAKILGETRCKLYTFADKEEKGYDANDFFIDGGTRQEFLSLIENESKYSFELYKKQDNKKGKKYGYKAGF